VPVKTEHGNAMLQVKIRGVDVFHPTTGEVRSDDADGIACWFIDTDYDEQSFFVRPCVLSRRGRPLRRAQDHAQGRDRPAGLGEPPERHLAAIRQAGRETTADDRRSRPG